MTARTLQCQQALRAIEQLTDLPAVRLCLEGMDVVAAFSPDASEHRRRAANGVGAVTSTGLLHGLWLLPSGVPVPVAAIPEVKRERLMAAGHFVRQSGAFFERTYSPAGVVKAIGFTGPNVSRSIENGIRFTPIVQRIVVLESSAPPPSPLLHLASEWGVGIVAAKNGAMDVLVKPDSAQIGVPAVYRWWLAELAYERWLQDNDQPVN